MMMTREPPCSRQAVSTALARFRAGHPCVGALSLICFPGWCPPQARKQSFVRHTVREYHIHKALDHPNVVRLHDVFEIDANTFCTVLDYCAPPFPRLLHHPPGDVNPSGGGGCYHCVCRTATGRGTNLAWERLRICVCVFVVRSSCTGLIAGDVHAQAPTETWTGT